MRKPWIVVFLAVGVTACSGNTSASTTTQPTTSTAGATVTTRPQIVDGGLVPVDPATLMPVPGAKPITQGDWLDGTVSPSGNWLAVQKWLSNGQQWVEVIDLTAREVVAETRVSQGASSLRISDDGTAFWISGGNRMTIYRLEQGANNREKIFDKFPEDFFTDTFQLLGDDRFGFFGIVSTEGQNQGDALIVIVDAGDDSVTQIALSHVDMGIISSSEPAGDVEALEIASPATVWDEENGRVLVVEATRDVVTEVNLSDGEITEHPWRSPEAGLDRLFGWLIATAQAKGPTAGISRDAVLSPDGQHLYVATSVRVIEEDRAVSSALDLIVLDTVTWDARVIDAKVDTLYPSPDGVFLLAQNVNATDGISDIPALPVYVIDMATAELLIGFQPGSTFATGVSFSFDGTFAYITSLSATETRIDIVDMELLQLTGALAFREISLIGEAGLMAFHLDE